VVVRQAGLSGRGITISLVARAWSLTEQWSARWMNFKRMKHILCTPSRVTNSQWQLFIISCCLHHHCRSWLLLLHDFFYFFNILFFSIESEVCIFVKKRVWKNLQKSLLHSFCSLSLCFFLTLFLSCPHGECSKSFI
jgi:hypothetical protein